MILMFINAKSRSGSFREILSSELHLRFNCWFRFSCLETRNWIVEGVFSIFLVDYECTLDVDWFQCSVKSCSGCHTISAMKPRPSAPDDRIFLLFVKSCWAEALPIAPRQMYTLSIQRWVGGRSFKVARRVALDQNGHSKTLHTDPPTHQNMLDCAFHTAALCSSPQSLQWSPARPPRMTGSSSFLLKAAELKRFRSHPLSSAVPRDEQGKRKRKSQRNTIARCLSGSKFHSPSAADFKRPDIIVPTDPMAPTKLLTVTKTPAVGTRPSFTHARK